MPSGKVQLASELVQNPHDREATHGVEGQGQQKKGKAGYRVRVATAAREHDDLEMDRVAAYCKS